MIRCKLNDDPATITAINGERITLSSPTAHAPGSRIKATVDGRELCIKVHRSLKEAESAEGAPSISFRVDGRMYDLTRELRNFLSEQLG